MAAKTKQKALAYLRVSSRGQVNGHGLDRQSDTIKKYARTHSLDVCEAYQDDISGTKELANRQGLAAMLDRLETNGVSTVLVERADRLARDLMVGEVILGQFRNVGVKVIAADSGADLTVGDDDPTRTLIRQVLMAVSQFEKSVIVLKLRAARERMRRKTGRCEGRKPFGSRPGEAKVLDRMKQLRRKPRGGRRKSFAQIAAILNAEGCATRTGKPWNPGTVWAILRRVRQ